MANIFDYMNWRDISMENVEFNEIDNLILARLAYFPFDGLIDDKEKITILEAYERYLKKEERGKILQEEDLQLFPTLANSVRFGQLKLSNYINKIDLTLEKQFSAITIELPNNTIYVSYRGTDNTVIGWKEDLNMSFKNNVPAQTDAAKYLNRISMEYIKEYNSKLSIRVGGHSKGGNLAVYAAAFANDDVKCRITDIYNNDGPGFQEEITETKEYQSILKKVHTYVPQSSVFGRLLFHQEEINILKSVQKGIMQHDLYSWQVLGDHFIKDEVTNSSEFIDKTLNNWLIYGDPQQREKFVDDLFEILFATQEQTLSDIGSNKLSSAKIMISTYKNMDDESKELMTQAVKVLFEICKNNIMEKTKGTRPIVQLRTKGTRPTVQLRTKGTH